MPMTPDERDLLLALTELCLLGGMPDGYRQAVMNRGVMLPEYRSLVDLRDRVGVFTPACDPAISRTRFDLSKIEELFAEAMVNLGKPQRHQQTLFRRPFSWLRRLWK